MLLCYYEYICYYVETVDAVSFLPSVLQKRDCKIRGTLHDCTCTYVACRDNIEYFKMRRAVINTRPKKDPM